MTRTCPMCGSQSLRIVHDDYKYEWPDGTQHVFRDATWETCDACEEVLIPPELGERIEKQRYINEELLSPQEIKAIREKLHLTQMEMAEFIGIGAKTYTRWETGASIQNKSSDTLIRLADAHPELFLETEARRRKRDRMTVLSDWFQSLLKNKSQNVAAVYAHGERPSSEKAKAIRRGLQRLIDQRSEQDDGNDTI